MRTLRDIARHPDLWVTKSCTTQALDVPGRWWFPPRRYESTMVIRDSARAIIGDDSVDLRIEVDWAWVEREARRLRGGH